MAGKLYDEESIKSLPPREFTRLRPQVYCGSTEYSTQLLIEILSNSIDEFRAGHGDRINISINTKSNEISVEDNGQGFLVGVMREDGKSILEAAFSVLNTSGKFNNDGVYEGVSLGLYGIGAKLCCFLSKRLEVRTQNNGQIEKIVFEDGIFKERKIIEPTPKYKSVTGTTVTWIPDPQFFTNAGVDIKEIKNQLQIYAALCVGLTITLSIDDDDTIVYHSKRGLNDILDIVTKDKQELISNRLLINYQEGKYGLDFAMTYVTSYSSSIIGYVNAGLTDSGAHFSQLKTTLTREFNKFLRDKKWLKEKDDNLTGDDIQEGLIIVFNYTAPNVAYDAQVKTRVSAIDTKPLTTTFIEHLNAWFVNNEREIKQVADKAINARKAREASKKAREAVRKPKDKGLKAKLQLSKKFIDCSNKNPAERNLLLVEGNSAAGSAVEARNPKTDCIYMLRGKVISPLRTTLDKLLKNLEISELINIIGGGFGDDFDISKINFDKIVITSDADADGDDIELLLITFFYTYMRPLVEAGKLYRAVTPLYIVKGKKDQYFYTEQEYTDWRINNPGDHNVVRAKGLGELNPEELHEVCFKNQRFRRIKVVDAEKTTEFLEILQGKEVASRKQYIYDNANHLGFNFD